jgi:predicted enzyme related to lactoylglutathione lyase
MLRGVATVNLWADDLEAAKDWYAELLGVPPYFERRSDDGSPGYFEFRFGDYQTELGLIDARYRPPALSPQPGGAVLNWAVDDVHAAFARLQSLGATVVEPVIERGEGFITASVLDPFGNVIGVMANPHYLEVLKG